MRINVNNTYKYNMCTFIKVCWEKHAYGNKYIQTHNHHNDDNVSVDPCKTNACMQNTRIEMVVTAHVSQFLDILCNTSTWRHIYKRWLLNWKVWDEFRRAKEFQDDIMTKLVLLLEHTKKRLIITLFRIKHYHIVLNMY